MNIAIDIRRSDEFGVGTYTRNVVRSLARLDSGESAPPRHRYILIALPARLREYRGLPENFVLQPFPWGAGSVRHAHRFRRLLREHECRLLHVPHMFKTPRLAPCPYVVTVHDLLGFLYRDGRQTEWQSWLRFRLGRRALHRAARIMAVSQTTRQDLARLFQLPPEKIETIYNAIDDRFRSGHATDADRSFIAGRYQVNYPFVLYAGNIKPHKNLPRVIESFSALKGRLAKEGILPDLKLIIIGDDLSSHPDLRRAVIRSGIQQEVRFLGFVPIEALRIFYDVAKVFLFPSLYEGFGLPPLEAMSLGTPVVTSNVSSLPEVVGDAAVLVNPENVFEISNAVYSVLVDQALREELKRKGYQRAAQYSWDEAARRILDVYERAAV